MLSPPGRDLLVQNVFDETKSFEFHLARSASCSPTIQKILQFGSPVLVRRYAVAIMDKYVTVYHHSEFLILCFV
jgi:hypothetical protein